MRNMGLRGAIRGKPLRTTISDKAAPCPLDHVNRQFHSFGRIGFGSRFSDVSAWAGFVYVAFVIGASPGRSSAGERAGRRTPTSFSTPWSRRSMTEGQPAAPASSIIAIVRDNRQFPGGLIPHCDGPPVSWRREAPGAA